MIKFFVKTRWPSNLSNYHNIKKHYQPKFKDGTDKTNIDSPKAKRHRFDTRPFLNLSLNVKFEWCCRLILKWFSGEKISVTNQQIVNAQCHLLRIKPLLIKTGKPRNHIFRNTKTKNQKPVSSVLQLIHSFS